MDESEAIRRVFAKIQSLEPDNASRIMGYILLHDPGEEEMIRLASGHELLLLSYIDQAKACLGLRRPNTSPSTPPLPFPLNSPRILPPNDGSHLQSPVSYAGSRQDSPQLRYYGGNDFRGESVRDDSSVMSPRRRSDSLVFPYVDDGSFLANLEETNGGDGTALRPCSYFARGFCKSGSSCKFLHVEKTDPGSYGGHSPIAYNRGMDSLDEISLSELSPRGSVAAGSTTANQIYLTFPAESIFSDEDVARYFSKFGPVQDVRIPHQEKRMYGFVTFAYKETVRLILGRKNPHYVCGCRVLVKPYKEKGKALEKKWKPQQQHREWGESVEGLGPSRFDSRELIDVPIGPRMSLSPQDTMLRRNSDLQHAMEHQSRRMTHLQLTDTETQNQGNDVLQNILPDFHYFSSRLPQRVGAFGSTNQGDSEVVGIQELNGGRMLAMPPISSDDLELNWEVIDSPTSNNTKANDQHVNGNDCDISVSSLEYFLPDNLFATPLKVAPELPSVASDAKDSTPDTATATNMNNAPSGSSLHAASSIKPSCSSNA